MCLNWVSFWNNGSNTVQARLSFAGRAKHSSSQSGLDTCLEFLLYTLGLENGLISFIDLNLKHFIPITFK